MPIRMPGGGTDIAQPDVQRHPEDDIQSRIAVAQRNSANLVPVSTLLDLAQLSASQSDVAITARRMARTWDVAPQVMFGQQDPRKVISQITGQPVNMKEAQRFTNYYAPAAILSMLREHVQMAVPGLPHPGRVATPQSGAPTAEAVGKMANVVARQFDMGLPEGIALSAMLVQRGVKPANFEANLPLVKTWLAANGQDPGNLGRLIGWTQAASLKGRASSVEELQGLLFSKKAVDQSKELDAVLASAKIQSDGSLWAEGPGGQWHSYADKQAIADEYGKAGIAQGQVPVVTSYDLGPDYFKQVQSIANEVKLDQQAFSNSVIGYGIQHIMAIGNQVYHGMEKGIWDAALGVASGFRPQTYTDPSGAYRTLVNAHQESWRRMEAGQNVGELTRQGWSEITGVDLPDWTGQALDFLIIWELDPTAIGGKLTRAMRAERLLPGIENTGIVSRALENAPGIGKTVENLNQAERVNRFQRWQNYVLNTFPKSSESSKLFDAAMTSDVKLFDKLDQMDRGAVANRTLDHGYIQTLRDEIIKRYGEVVGHTGSGPLSYVIPAVNKERAWQEWQDGMRGHFLTYGPPGSAAEVAVAERLRLMNGSVRDAVDNVTAPTPGGAQDFSGSVNATTAPEHGLNEYHMPFSQEAPGSTALARMGPRRLVRGLANRQDFTETALGKRVAALPNINYGREMPLYGDGAVQHITSEARRTSVFNNAEVRAYQAKATDIIGSGSRVESRLPELRASMDKEFIHRLLAPFHVTPEQELAFYNETFKLTDHINEAWKKDRGFLQIGPKEEDLVNLPVMETQLQNSIFVVDPVDVRAQLRRFTGMSGRMDAHLKNALGQDPKLFEQNLGLFHRGATQFIDFSAEMLRDARHLWKALVVARPGYIPRVILGDENARFLSISNSITERLMSQEHFAKLASKGEGMTIKFKDAEGNIFHEIPLPGLYEKNPLALNDVRGAELTTDLLRTARRYDLSHGTPSITWGKPVYASSVGAPAGAFVKESSHLDAWSWALTKQMGQSVPGRVALQSVRDGGDVLATQEALVRWAQADKYVILRQRIGVEFDHVNDWANQLATGVHAYTMDNANIAAMALDANAKDLRKFLKMNTSRDLRPPVHGPTIDTLVRGADYSAGTRVVNQMYKYLVQKPEAALNRHPFFKMMKRRADIGYYTVVEQTGTKLTPELKLAIDHASTEFAKEQVNRVMFDFTKQSRFTELAEFLFPFPQPFFEGFQAWGHIIRRNPATIARARALYQLGVGTKFITTDPTTGQQVVNLDALYWPTRLLDKLLPGTFSSEAGLNALGVNFVSPLVNFNMLANQTMKLPKGGPWGKIWGGVPIPYPGLRPEVAWLGQWAFKNTHNETLTSMLFQNGPSASMFIPRQVQAVLQVIAPNQFKAAGQEPMIMNILRAYQAEHIYFDKNGKALIPEDQIIAHATQDAKNLTLLRTWVGLISPASPQARTAADPNAELWQQYLDAAPDYSTALAKWSKDHPDLWLTPIGKTFYEGFVENPLTGEKFRGPRLPSSEIVGKMLSTPGIGDLMKNDKAWAGLLLIGLDPGVTEAQDWPTYSKLLANGTFRYKTPQEFYGQGEDGRMWHQIGEINNIYYNKLSVLESKGISLNGNDPALELAKNWRQQQYAQLADESPTWMASHYIYSDGVWKGTDQPGRPMDTIVAQAKHIVAQAGFQDFPGVQALQRYLNLRDNIKAKMEAKGYTDIMLPSAIDLTKSYTAGVNKIIAQTPAIAPYLSAMFGVHVEGDVLNTTDDLRDLASPALKAIQALPADLQGPVADYNTKYRSMNPYQKNFDTKWQRSQAYLDLQKYQDGVYTNNPKIVNGWWKALGPRGQADYRSNLATKPPEFYNRFDWHLAGVNLTDKGAQSVQNLSAWWVSYTKAKENDPNLASSDWFNTLNGQIAIYMNGPGKKNGFNKAVEKMNDWAFPLEAAKLAEQPGKLGRYWDLAIKSTRALQQWTDSHGYTGISGNKDPANTLYNNTQAQFMEFVKTQWFANSPGFKKQWYEIQNELGGDPLIGSVIMPDTYYGPMGVQNYGKGV